MHPLVLLPAVSLFPPLVSSAWQLDLLFEWPENASIHRKIKKTTVDLQSSTISNAFSELYSKCLYTLASPTGVFPPSYPVPSVLNDANFLRQDFDEPMSLSLTEHHATDGGHQSLVGQVQWSISRIHHCH